MQPLAASLCEYLSWDSEFFGCRIGRFTGERLSLASIEQVTHWCHRNRVDCLYFLADASDAESVRVAEENRFDFVDIRMTLSSELARTGRESTRTLPGVVRGHRPEDVPGLRAIARQSHRDTRFYSDLHFAREKCDGLYETWIERSCEGYADVVFVAHHEGRPAGYITCKTQQPGVGQIGLLAVAESASGLGFGSALIAAALEWCRSQSHERITVVTQGRNVPAQRCYQKSGFLTERVQLWFHRWFPPGQLEPSK